MPVCGNYLFFELPKKIVLNPKDGTLRNAMIPVITYVGPMTAYILTGSLVVERIFTIGGLGAKFVDCIINRDYPMIMGTTIFLATLMITMNLITDIVYKIVDPRIKLD